VQCTTTNCIQHHPRDPKLHYRQCHTAAAHAAVPLFCACCCCCCCCHRPRCLAQGNHCAAATSAPAPAAAAACMALHSGLWLFQCATWQALLQYLYDTKAGKQQQKPQQHSACECKLSRT
jgi:hypothetical protein